MAASLFATSVLLLVLVLMGTTVALRVTVPRMPTTCPGIANRLSSPLRLALTQERQTTAVNAAKAFAAAALLFVLPPLESARAFDNAVPNIYSSPKSPGPKPTNLGIDKSGKLRMCLKPSPNCFSTTPDRMSADDDEEDDEDLTSSSSASASQSNWGAEDIHAIPRWRFAAGTTPAQAYAALGQALSAYTPGQQGVDGGGFKVITADSDRRYYYAQFESLRRGYIDDVELKVDDDCSVQVVSSSRLGYLDFQVNAKRLNALTEALRSRGDFSAEPITPKSHPVYFDSNRDVVRAAPGESPSGGLGLGKKRY